MPYDDDLLPSPCQQLWAQMLMEKKEALAGVNADRVLSIETFSALQNSAKSLQSKARKDRITRTLLTLSPVVQRLQSLIKAVSIFIQSDPTYSALVWGGLLVCLECFSRTTRALDDICALFDKMTGAMPRFETYMQLYPNNPGLEKILLDIYRNYADAIISAITFFRQKPWWRTFSSVFGLVVQNFDRARDAIKEQTVEFERETKAAHDVEAARHRLWVEKALPVSRMLAAHEPPASLFLVPYSQNGAFLGQANELREVLSYLQDSANSQKSCIIHGIGGVGKTQLALEFCYRFRDKFPFILWVSAQDETTLSRSYAAIAKSLSLYDGNQRPGPLVVGLTRGWLCDHRNWLLIFDNVDGDTSVLNQFWPPCSHGAIILTSQRTDLSLRTASSLRLKPLSKNEGSELLLQRLPEHTSGLDIKLAREICKEVDGLPLLLVGLSGFISQSDVSLDDVLRALRESRQAPSYLFFDAAAYQYERPIQLVFEMSLKQLPWVARYVINIMSMLSPGEIPENLLLMEPPESEKAKSMWFAREVRQPLCSRHLIDVRHKDSRFKRMYSIHRSVQRSVMNLLSDDPVGLQTAFDQAVGIIYAYLPRPSAIMVPGLTGFDLFVRYMPHVLSIHETYLQYENNLSPTAELAEMICSSTAYLYEIGLASLCLKVAETGTRVCHRLSQQPTSFDPAPRAVHSRFNPCTYSNHPALSVTTLAANISAYGAGVIWTTGGLINRQQGHDMTWRVLELREKHIQCCTITPCSIEEQNLLSNAYNDWALQLINEGRYQEAKPFSEKSLQMKHRLLDGGKDQFQFFISKILLAFVLLSEGNVEKAPRMAQEALEHIEKEKGPDHPFTLHYKFHIGNVWASIGEYRKALDVHRASVEARTALFGQANHDTLNGHFAIALCLYRLAEFMDARAHIDKCLAQQQAANWGSEHLLRAKYLHALIMQGLNETGDGWKMEEELAITERNSLLAEYGGGGKRPDRDRGGTDEFGYFDYLVNVHAGRTSFIQLEDC